MFLLDTDTVSFHLRGCESVVSKISQAGRTGVAISCITKAELMYGARRRFSVRGKKYKEILELANLFRVLPFDESCAEIFAHDKVKLERNGKRLDDIDLMIASVAKANNLVLVTHNLKHFSRVSGLKVEDWVLS